LSCSQGEKKDKVFFSLRYSQGEQFFFNLANKIIFRLYFFGTKKITVNTRCTVFNNFSDILKSQSQEVNDREKKHGKNVNY